MANTYTQIHIQAIFAVKKRTGLIKGEWKDELYKYLTGIIQAYDHKLLAINGMPDHIHIFFGMRPVQSLSDLMQEVKEDSSKWINQKKFIPDKFEWQQGFGAFSYSKSHVSRVIANVLNQENIIMQSHFWMNTKNYWKNLRSNMMNDIFLNPWNNILIQIDPQNHEACNLTADIMNN